MQQKKQHHRKLLLNSVHLNVTRSVAEAGQAQDKRTVVLQWFELQ